MTQKPPLLTMREAREQKLWFVSKHFGFGWVPIAWQGWVTLLGFVVLVVALVFLNFGFGPRSIATSTQVSLFIGLLIIFIFCLVGICIKKGEKAYWRWGE